MKFIVVLSFLLYFPPAFASIISDFNQCKFIDDLASYRSGNRANKIFVHYYQSNIADCEYVYGMTTYKIGLWQVQAFIEYFRQLLKPLPKWNH